jgi:hypothetical protein
MRELVLGVFLGRRGGGTFPDVGKVTLKSKVDEALSDEFL